MLVQLKIITRIKTASKWLEKQTDSNTRKVIFISFFFQKMEFRTYFVYFHSLSNKNQSPMNVHKVWANFGINKKFTFQFSWNNPLKIKVITKPEHPQLFCTADTVRITAWLTTCRRTSSPCAQDVMTKGQWEWLQYRVFFKGGSACNIVYVLPPLQAT